MSNAVKMSLEEKLVQQIKETSLGSLMDDEDAIVTLTKRAITEALFTERTETVGSGYNQTTKRVPSAVQQAANDVATVAINSLMVELLAKVLNDPKTMETLQKCMVTLLPGVIMRNLDQHVHMVNKSIQINALQTLANAFLSSNNTADGQATLNAAQNIVNQAQVNTFYP